MLETLEEIGFRFRLNENRLEWRCLNDQIRPETARKIVSQLDAGECMAYLRTRPAGFILASGMDEIRQFAKAIFVAMETGELTDFSVTRYAGPEVLFTFHPAAWRATE